MAATWIDLLDPSAEELRAKAPRELEDTALAQLLSPPQHEDEPRPTLVGHGDYVFGVFLIEREARLRLHRPQQGAKARRLGRDARLPPRG